MFNVETTAEFKVWPRNIKSGKHFTESQDPNKGMFQLCCNGWNYQQYSILLIIEICLFNKPHSLYQILKINNKRTHGIYKILGFLHAHTLSGHANICIFPRKSHVFTADDMQK